MTATTECSRCGGSGREPLPLPDGPSTIPCPGNDADPPGCDGAGVVPVESPIPDLMAALEQSIAAAKAARDRRKNGSPDIRENP